MKHTDNFFLFPIKCYDERILAEDEEETREWVLGYGRFPMSELYEITWQDTYSKDRTSEEASKNGPDLTKVYSARYGEFICMWPRKKFENKLNDYMEKIQDEILKDGEHVDNTGQVGSLSKSL